MNINKRTTLSSLILLSLAGCGGGGDGSSDSSNASSPDTASVMVIDGVWEKATVCLDSNKNGQCDPDEETALTNANGIATFEKSKLNDIDIIAIIRAGVSIDKDRGLASTGQTYVAAHGETVLSPWSTLAATFDDEDPYTKVFEKLPSLGTPDELKKISSTDWTKSENVTNKQFKSISQVINDMLRDHPSETNLILNTLSSVGNAISNIDTEDLEEYSLNFDKNNNGFNFNQNFRPKVEGTIQDVSITYDGEPITDIDLNILFSDRDGDSLTFDITPMVEGLTISNGILSGVPEKGNYTVFINADDGKDKSKPIIFKIDALGEEKPPKQLVSVVNFERFPDTLNDATTYEPYKNTFIRAETISGTVFIQIMETDGTWKSYPFRDPDFAWGDPDGGSVSIDADGNLYITLLDSHFGEQYYLVSDDLSEMTQISSETLSSRKCHTHPLSRMYCQDWSKIVRVNQYNTGFAYTIGGVSVGSGHLPIPALNGTFVDRSDVREVVKTYYNSNYNNVTTVVSYRDSFNGELYLGLAFIILDLETEEVTMDTQTWKIDRHDFLFDDLIAFSTPDGVTGLLHNVIFNYHFDTRSAVSSTFNLSNLGLGDGSDSDWYHSLPIDSNGNSVVVYENYNDLNYVLKPIYNTQQ
ncbi:hypothetical protein BIY21_08330 [Vibrio ponticus]|uniref:Dystroglycan-type cadherin-like domain-containing protein n=1 Tax=Vibrio ponticus TaxID=265668 RepID=A0ABX3FN35_9VIBR|nr:hypothetical protein [Vibrio ponticus]OLQ94599.1 hypothetical protein BIY21_08330 [Vibrio ponticus]